MRCTRTFVWLVLFFLSFVLAFGEAGAPGPVTPIENRATPPVMVIGFVGGFVKHDAHAHSTVQVVEHLRNEYREGVYVQSFANRHRDQAYKEILRRLDGDKDGTLSAEEKHNARIVIFGHSWGASETVTLARRLERDGIPVLLTIQVDSVAKVGQNDSVIPANVGQAINFYQPDGIIHGRPQIRAADPLRTEILGNFRYEYSAKPISCEGYPWFDRILVKAHTEIECDPKVWSQVESLIYKKLSPEARATAAR
jgi:pimeloyl-ACP methyl ester carboxylesterase